MKLLLNLLLLLNLTVLSGAIFAAPEIDENDIDRRSFTLGGIASWAEVVDIGIKKMALSAAASSEVMDGLVEAAEDIAKWAKVEIYREPEFLTTDLFPLAATKDKEVLIIYKGNTLEEYKALKARKAGLVKSGNYSGDARREIAWTMGKLLSYPDAKIEQLMSKNAGK